MHTPVAEEARFFDENGVRIEERRHVPARMATERPLLLESDMRFRVAICALALFNALDLLFTLTWLCRGLACEANPLLAAAWHVHPAAFVGVKSVLVTGGAAILDRFRAIPAAQHAAIASAIVYAAVVGWHLLHLGLLAQ